MEPSIKALYVGTNSNHKENISCKLPNDKHNKCAKVGKLTIMQCPLQHTETRTVGYALRFPHTEKGVVIRSDSNNNKKNSMD